MKIYQIRITGKRKYFDAEVRFHSQKVYATEPTTEQIEEFIVKCCDNEGPTGLMDLDRNTITKKILELTLIK